MRLDECLFVAVSVLLALDVLLLHLLVLLTLLLPVEFKVDVACDICDWQVLLCQFHNFLEGVLVLKTKVVELQRAKSQDLGTWTLTLSMIIILTIVML